MHGLRKILRDFLAGFRSDHAPRAGPQLRERALEDVLPGLAGEEDAAAIWQLLPFLFSRSVDTSVAATNAIAARLRAVPPDDLPEIETLIRVSGRGWYWESSLGDELQRRMGIRPDADVLGFLSFHQNGYVREAAVKQLAVLHDGPELRYLLLRLNDWVPQVRDAARQAVIDRTRIDSVAAFARNFLLVARAMRGQHGASLVEPFAAIFATAPGQAAILWELEAGSRTAARFLVRFAIDHVPDALDAIVPAAVRSSDAMVRSWVIPLVARALPREDALAILQRLAADALPIIRRESLRALSQSFPDEAQPHLERAVLDSSASVREASRFLLRERRIDFAATYRKAMDRAVTSAQLATAIAGLAETGTATDAQAAVRHLSHPIARVRRAAVKCVMRLSGGPYLEQITAALQDTSAAVSAAARDALRRHARDLDPSRLTEIFTGTNLRHARRNVLTLFTELPKWQSITHLLHAATDADEEIAAEALRHVQAWNNQYNRRQIVPSRSELEALTDALATAEPMLDRVTADQIRFAVQSFQ